MSAHDSLVSTELEAGVRALALPIGLPIHALDSVGSTNDEAHRLAALDAPHGTLVVADQQTQGRGRLGRKWFSPPGQNLYLSLLLRPQVPIERLASLTLFVGLAVADTLAKCVDSRLVQIKWPNDIWIDSKKAVGILVESSMLDTRVSHVVAGIGINVHQRSFDPEIESIATSIAQYTDTCPSRPDVLISVLQHLAHRMEQFEHEGLPSVVDELRARDATLGRRVRSMVGEGRGDGIQEDGRLMLMMDDGQRQAVSAGDIEVIA